jgi:hypothetical protein
MRNAILIAFYIRKIKKTRKKKFLIARVRIPDHAIDRFAIGCFQSADKGKNESKIHYLVNVRTKKENHSIVMYMCLCIHCYM